MLAAPADLAVARPTVADPSPGRALHHTSVVTPEAALLEYRTAGLASRAVAKAIDLVAQGLLLWFLMFIVLAVVAAGAELAATVLALAVGGIVVFGYPLIEAVWGGRTPGKKALGLRVITIEGAPVRFRHAFIRSLVAPVEFLILAGGLGAMLAALLSPRSQRLGDMAAGTLVVRSRLEAPRSVHWAPPRGAERFALEFDAGGLTPRHYSIAREFLLRVSEFEPRARFRLAAELSDRLATRCGVARPDGLHPEHYLNAAVFAYQQRFAQSL